MDKYDLHDHFFDSIRDHHILRYKLNRISRSRGFKGFCDYGEVCLEHIGREVLSALIRVRHFVYYISGECGDYVGVTGHFVKRMLKHHSNGVITENSRVFILSRHANREDANWTESHFIHKMRPTINKALPPQCERIPPTKLLPIKCNVVHNPVFYELCRREHTMQENYVAYINHCYYTGESPRISYRQWWETLTLAKWGDRSNGRYRSVIWPKGSYESKNRNL